MAAIVTIINNKFQNWTSFFRITRSYIKRRNPLGCMLTNTLSSIQEFAASGQKLKALKYRVRLMNYRIYQMEQLIQQNNPQNFKGGHGLNKLQ